MSSGQLGARAGAPARDEQPPPPLPPKKKARLSKMHRMALVRAAKLPAAPVASPTGAEAAGAASSSGSAAVASAASTVGAAVVTAAALSQAEATAKVIFLRGPDREAAWTHHFDLRITPPRIVKARAGEAASRVLCSVYAKAPWPPDEDRPIYTASALRRNQYAKTYATAEEASGRMYQDLVAWAQERWQHECVATDRHWRHSARGRAARLRRDVEAIIVRLALKQKEEAAAARARRLQFSAVDIQREQLRTDRINKLATAVAAAVVTNLGNCAKELDVPTIHSETILKGYRNLSASDTGQFKPFVETDDRGVVEPAPPLSESVPLREVVQPDEASCEAEMMVAKAQMEAIIAQEDAAADMQDDEGSDGEDDDAHHRKGTSQGGTGGSLSFAATSTTCRRRT